ncbi:hypothetical protein TNCV_3514081 [Trichonephila clavipes]|nr:hypothetical protein TNCV_3514081 [Trichonephila clavipes]
MVEKNLPFSAPKNPGGVFSGKRDESVTMYFLNRAWSFSIYCSGAKGVSGGRLNIRSAGRRRARPKSIWDAE